MTRTSHSETNVKHMVTVRVSYEDKDRITEGDFSVALVNFSGELDLSGTGGETDIDLINESVREWINEEPMPDALFVELTLRKEFDGPQWFYEVVASMFCLMDLGHEMLAQVCPGCHSVATERCAPGCIDAEIAAEREEESDYREFGASDDEDDDA